MASTRGRVFPANVQGSVYVGHDFDTTLAVAKLAGLEDCGEDERHAVMRVFIGRVATDEAFEAVKEVEGVESLRFSQVAYSIP